MKSKILILAVLVVLLILLVSLFNGLGQISQRPPWDSGQSGNPPSNVPDGNGGSGEQVFCTLDALMCPDGSYVGRVPPSCQFADCPSSRGEIILNAVIGRESSGSGVSITPVQVIEDSRCPADAVCIQAGTVRVRANVEVERAQGSPEEVQEIFALNRPTTLFGADIELTGVLPYPNSGTNIRPEQYEFTFKIYKNKPDWGARRPCDIVIPMYERILKPVLFRFDPEYVHDFFTLAGMFIGSNPLTRAILSSVYGYRGKDISKVVDGIRYRTPFLLSAGFDYNGKLTRVLPLIGFGGEEIGSVTARPCAGNPRPRLTRLKESKSILVNKGLRNDGVEALITRLKRTKRSDDFVLGISIARTNDQKCSETEEGIEDYAYSFRRLNEENIGDYYTINISCPNAFGGETFTTPDLLQRLLNRLSEIPCKKPVYVKMPINISWDHFDSLLKVIQKHGLHGVVIGNLNKKYEDLDFRGEAPDEYRGGLSGKPCEELSNELIRRTRQAYGRTFTIIGVGGVMSPESAIRKFEAGADLVQMITGIIFKGPSLVKKMAKAVSQNA